MPLSICLLTRDAEAKMERVLKSVAALGAEVIVVDTGSTDRTVEAARALGANTSVMAWDNDFGAGQNYALGQASGDWVLWLNPDEELLPDGRDQLPALLANPAAFAYAVRVQQLLRPDRPEQTMETVYPRLFRRHPEVRFVGRLHPHFAVPLEELARRENKQILRSELAIRHHVYLSVPTPDKIRWTTRLLELELKDRPGQLHYLIEYGRNLLWLNDPKGHEILAQAADQVLAAANAPTPPAPTVASLLEYVLTVSPEQSRSRLTPAQARELTQRWFPNTPPLLWALAQRSFRTQDFRDAAGLLERLLQLGRTGAYDRSAAFDPAIMADAALVNLGNCYVALRDLDRAERCFTQAFASPAYQAQARQGYALVQELRRASR